MSANGRPTETELRKALEDVRELRAELQSAKADYVDTTERAESARERLHEIREEASQSNNHCR